jgi:aldehyde:ferredoxin oxidoreductase
LGAGKVRVASIGLAGEARLPFALILCDHGRVAGRTGMGAVMGAKNLKAIAVQGRGQIPVYDPQSYNARRSAANRGMRQDALIEMLRELGTSGGADYLNYLNEMPVRYFQRGKFADELRISGSWMKDNILAGISACHACVIACGRVVRLEDGEKRKGPEYETLVGFGPNLELNDAVLATRMGELCDRYGMDTISMSNIIGLAFRLNEIGAITPADTGGLALDWGAPEAVEALVHMTARREGFGAYLAEGARALGQHFGAGGEAVQVNGLEVPYHDPRGGSGMALVYATSPRGACHNQSDYFYVDLGQVEPALGMSFQDRLDGAEKAANVAIHQNWRTVFNSLVMCLFANVGPETVLELINSACGYDWTIPQMLQAGERGWNLKRAINNRLGLSRANDKLPKALLQPQADTEAGARFAPDLEAMLEAYYQASGWDSASGRPLECKLLELGLDWVARDLYPQQKSIQAGVG